MTTLIKHIKSLNEASRKEMAQSPGTFIGIMPETKEHWAEMNIHTVEDFQRYEFETYIYDAHKTAFGVKGRHYNFASMSMQELKDEADYISKACDEAMAEEEQAETQAKADFEKRVSDLIETGAGNREDAIRWILEAEGLADEHDAGYVCWNLGLAYSEQKTFENLIRKVA